MIEKNFGDLKKRVLTGCIGIFVLWYMYAKSHPIFLSLIIGVILVQMLNEWKTLANKTSQFLWLLFPVYPTIPLSILIQLNHDAHCRILLPIMLACIFTFDTGAYIFGKQFGKHRIAPKISPKKSWEGFIGGYASTLLMMFLFIPFIKNFGTFFLVPIITLFICAISTIGDFFESFLKRRAGVKDSGDILPGHGGALDRFDSILFVAPFFYLFRHFLMLIFTV